MAQTGTPVIHWFRNDLRLGDNPALYDASLNSEGQVLPLYTWNPDGDEPWPLGGASKWRLHHSLIALDEALRKKGTRLIIRAGHPLDIITEIANQTGAQAISWNRRYEPHLIELDRNLKRQLEELGFQVTTKNGHLLNEPWTISTQQSKPYQVFTAYWKACLRHEPGEPLPGPHTLKPVPDSISSDKLETLRLRPAIPWDQSFKGHWNSGTEAAKHDLQNFFNARLKDYSEARNRLDILGGSGLSDHLRWGEISARQVWQETKRQLINRPELKSVADKFLSEIGWREFAYHLLYHFPNTPTEALRTPFQDFPWQHDSGTLAAWQKGQTGYPVVDASMRCLWTTGSMPNRARMIVASFLTKHLLIPWQRGAEWFWDTLVDADLASNTLGWQWTAGCGADAAPYFRIFNPVTQAEKFDPEGQFIRTWIPELAPLPMSLLAQPWKLSASQAQAYGIELGRDYPHPIIDHQKARVRALRAYDEIKAS